VVVGYLSTHVDENQVRQIDRKDNYFSQEWGSQLLLILDQITDVK